MKNRIRTVLGMGLLASAFGASEASAFDRVQPPELGLGKRASLAGALANTTFGPADVTRGGFTLPAPFEAPKARGELLAPIFPSYSPDNGISPWGMGFNNSLALTRTRIAGSLTYDFAKGDELIGPFGRLTRGTDGNWYPVGLEKAIRVVASGNDFVAYLPDGARWTFGGTARVVSTSGTYAWQLREVRDAVGHVTTLTWTTNPSGNQFLASVEYGGRASSQYRIDLAYESVGLTDSLGVAQPKFVDYRSGGAIALDRRVKTVTIRARNAARGTFDERYHYTLGYTEEKVGAAFYLTRIDTVYASGESVPPTLYAYNLKGAELGTSPLREVPQLTALFKTLGVGVDAIQPTRSGITDVDLDGNADLELGDNARTVVSQKGSGTAEDPLRFEASAVPVSMAPDCATAGQVGCFYEPCSPFGDSGVSMAPRLLSQLNPTDTALQVVQFQFDSDAGNTAINVCSRDGLRTSTQTVSANWQASDRVRFVDLNSDHLPDLVRISAGRFEVLPNTTVVAGKEARLGWGNPVSGALLTKDGQPITPEAVWVSDASGDGIPDLVGQYGDAIEVWHGLGNYRFVANAQEMRFFDKDGNRFGSFDHYKIVPADLNKDGLQDYFLTNREGDTTNSRFITYFTNVGGRFVQTPIAALDHLPEGASAPVIATLDGSGNMAVTVTNQGLAYSVALDGPGTGLMASADDGKGTVLSFEYTRGPASPGIRQRYSLLSTMRVQSSGYDTVAYDYRYATPTMHSVGRFLVGFDRVTRREGDLPAAPLGSNVMTFLNGDAWGGLLLDGKQTDVRSPDVVKVDAKTYSDAVFLGIPYKRLASSTSGWTSADGSKRAVDVTTYDAYASDFCASQTTLTTASHGTLVTQVTRANPVALANHLHCLEAGVVQTGKHGDATMDFREERSIARNASGRITQIAVLGAAGPMVEQQVDYDAENDPIRISVPGKGATTMGYDPVTKLPATGTAPDGVVTQVASRDPVTDAVLDVFTSRGGAGFHDRASYDGQERLATRWNDLDGSSALAPHQRYSYSYATTNHPGTVTEHTLVDLATGVYRDTNELFTAADERLGKAQLHASGWVFDGFTARSRAHRQEDRLLVNGLAAGTSFAALDYATLLKGAPVTVSGSTGTTFGSEIGSRARLHADVTKVSATSVSVNASGQISRTTLVNGTNATTTLLDPAMKLTLAYVDEAQAASSYAYDALGRFRSVALPDGARHKVTIDGYGRESAISRDGIARIARTYVAIGGGTTDLVATQSFASAPVSGASVPVRSIAWTYDASGRKVTEKHTDVASAASSTFTYFYDGATPAAPTARTALGLLTAVTGDGYSKMFLYRADGQVTHRDVTLTGFRTIATDIAYREDGTRRDETVTVKDSTGKVVQTSVHRQDVDAFGRPSSTSVNGALLAASSYDAFGRLAAVSFSSGDSVAYAYDDLTRESVGFDETRANGAWSGMASTRIKRNDRGFVGQELLGVGPSTVQRAYSYSPQGFLTLAVDGAR
jgi:YD repeat-containing protein